MPDLPISLLPPAAALGDDDLFAVVQAGVTDRATLGQVRDGVLADLAAQPVLAGLVGIGQFQYVLPTNNAAYVAGTPRLDVDFHFSQVTGITLVFLNWSLVALSDTTSPFSFSLLVDVVGSLPFPSPSCLIAQPHAAAGQVFSVGQTYFFANNTAPPWELRVTAELSTADPMFSLRSAIAEALCVATIVPQPDTLVTTVVVVTTAFTLGTESADDLATESGQELTTE